MLNQNQYEVELFFYAGKVSIISYFLRTNPLGSADFNKLSINNANHFVKDQQLIVFLTAVVSCWLLVVSE